MRRLGYDISNQTHFLYGILGAWLFLISSGALLAATPPPGFTETQLVTGNSSLGASSPTAIAYEPGAGNLWITEKGSGSSSGSDLAPK